MSKNCVRGTCTWGPYLDVEGEEEEGARGARKASVWCGKWLVVRALYSHDPRQPLAHVGLCNGGHKVCQVGSRVLLGADPD